MAYWLRLPSRLCRKSGDLDSIPEECWTLRFSHFAWHWARQCTDTRAAYIAALSIFFLLGFRQWRSRADRVVNLNTTILRWTFPTLWCICDTFPGILWIFNFLPLFLIFILFLALIRAGLIKGPQQTDEGWVYPWFYWIFLGKLFS